MKPWNGAPPTSVDLTSVITPTSGWDVAHFWALNVNGWVTVCFHISRTGGTISGGTGGDIPNVTLSDIPAAYLPGWDVGWAATQAGKYGAFGLVRPNATLLLTALSDSGASIASGEYLTASTSYPAGG